MEPKPVILAVTAHAYTEECQKMLGAGGDNFLAKPFRDRDLFDMLACHLSIQVNYAESAPLPESESSLPMKLYSPLVAVLLALPFAGCVSVTPRAKPVPFFCNPISLN
jgi:CheY-like chemotaxis protein